MNFLILGSGGREHALAWKIGQSEDVTKVYLMPGNAGAELSPKVECLDRNPADRGELLNVLREIKPELTIIGPEKLLAEGVVDFIEENGFKAFGPSKEAAILESSKAFSKDFMFQHDIPTAKYQTYHSSKDAYDSLDSWDFEVGVVLKADSLAAGKGVVVTHSRDEAEKVIHDFMENPDCSVKTKSLVIEEKLVGKEVSAFAICDGENFVELGYICDYKAVADGNLGPNTGGMGCYSPKDWAKQ